MQEVISDLIGQALEQEVRIIDTQALGGGSINQVSCITLDNGTRFLLKQQSAAVPDDTFQIEFDSLQLLAQVGTIRVPQPLVCGDDFLVMEFIEPGAKAPDWAEQMGRGLALLQQQAQQDRFGFHCDNYLGTTAQVNGWRDSWLKFWREQRLDFQLRLFAEQAGADDPLLSKGGLLLERLGDYLGSIDEPAVLLHGDLWSGNTMADEPGSPVILDPACYYGHREAEFGMMRLFGGFGPECEAAYAEIWPFEPGFEERFRLYQLYHELNHLNLFGQAYYGASMASIEALL